MDTELIEGAVVSGHKEDALEVPFDPKARWGIEPAQVRPGRRGFPVRAELGKHVFATYVVARSGRFWLLLPPVVEEKAGIRPGSRVSVSLRAAPPES